ncbi:TrbG/VirB9 family P-type conjugative transfer protein [Insolitispirillum peregrinum]|uniref:TrbG/VirB9 family P-type conjugative transfer protein n=1 Tax=Insolitispirillum peregrinum TaxID=80876 RepID=UPI003613007D
MKHALFGAAIALIAVNAPGLSAAQTSLTPPPASGSNQPFSGAPPAGKPGTSSTSASAGQASPAGKPTAAPGTGKPAATPDPAAVKPVSAYQMQSATDQADGYFPPLARGPIGGQIQESWNKAPADAGVQTLPVCGGSCVYRVLLRQYMTTTIQLPADARIVSADLGDNASFQVAVRGSNMVAVKPLHYGVDTNINVYTEHGNIYSFYLRAENPMSGHIPDLLVRVQGSDAPSDGLITLAPGDASPLPGQTGAAGGQTAGKGKEPPLTSRQKAALEGLEGPKTSVPAQQGDWVREVPFDPSTLHGFDDYELWGDEELKPVRVFRDKVFTYVQYGDKWDTGSGQAAFTVVDHVDEPVNTRVVGSTLVIESTAPLISLKNGKKFLCIKYTGD